MSSANWSVIQQPWPIYIPWNLLRTRCIIQSMARPNRTGNSGEHWQTRFKRNLWRLFALGADARLRWPIVSVWQSGWLIRPSVVSKYTTEWLPATPKSSKHAVVRLWNIHHYFGIRHRVKICQTTSSSTKINLNGSSSCVTNNSKPV